MGNNGRKKKINWIRRILFAFIGFALWSDYFAFPLSDFPSVLALSLSLVLIFEKPTLLKLTVAGLLFAAAVNIRPMYLIISPVILCIVIFSHSKTQIRFIHKHLLTFLLGFCIVSAPQLLINYKHKGNFSPFTKSEYKGRNLYLTQLEWGITIQKHETNIGESYPDPHMFFYDPAGQEIFRKENLTVFNSLGAYIELILKYPLDFGALYLRHLFNGLDIQYKSPYILKPSKFLWPVVLLNYTIIFLALVVLFFRKIKNFDLKKVSIVLMIFLICLIVLPTAIECRFLIPLHLFFYCLVCFGWPTDWQPKHFSFQTKLKFIAAFLIFLMTCFALSTNTQVNLEHGPRLIGL